MSSGWSWYVIALIVLNIGGCAWLLWWTAKRRPGDPKPEDTSHVWDGDLTEYNKPLPKWWINLFWLTIVFGIGYLLWYPGLGSFPGYAKWTQQGEHATQKAAYDEACGDAPAPDLAPTVLLAARGLDPKVRILVRTRYVREREALLGLGADAVVVDEDAVAHEVSALLESAADPVARPGP